MKTQIKQIVEYLDEVYNISLVDDIEEFVSLEKEVKDPIFDDDLILNVIYDEQWSIYLEDRNLINEATSDINEDHIYLFRGNIDNLEDLGTLMHMIENNWND